MICDPLKNKGAIHCILALTPVHCVPNRWFMPFTQSAANETQQTVKQLLMKANIRLPGSYRCKSTALL